MSKLKKALAKAKAAREQDPFSNAGAAMADEKVIAAGRPGKALGRKPAVEEKEQDTTPREGDLKAPAQIQPVEPVKREESFRKEISPGYSQTRVTSIDPAFLKKNKILSLFHEEEISDQIKILSTQILNKMAEIGGNSLLITSARPSEGKTFTAINPTTIVNVL